MYLPALQLLHEVWAWLSWYIPDKHFEHVVRLAWLIFPGMQGRQKGLLSSFWTYPDGH
jgi:hypothetical protein